MVARQAAERSARQVDELVRMMGQSPFTQAHERVFAMVGLLGSLFPVTDSHTIMLAMAIEKLREINAA